MSCIINVSFWKLYCWRCLSILPRSSTHKFQWWGSDRGSYFIPKKITTSEFVYPKKSLLFLPYPKKTLTPFFATQKYPSGFFCNPKKILASFIDPKKSLLAKIPPPSPVIRICEWGPCGLLIMTQATSLSLEMNKRQMLPQLYTSHMKLTWLVHEPRQIWYLIMFVLCSGSPVT